MTAALLRRLRLERFRNFLALDWRPDAGWNRIEAANGAGKTSLLEAIYLAATGRSFRTADLGDLRPRDGAPPAPEEGEGTSVAAEVERDGVWEIGVTLRPRGEVAPERTVQGKPATLAEQLAILPLVVWSEAEHDLVRGADRVRRRFLDRALLLLAPATVGIEAEHTRAWRQKRHLLAAGGAASATLATWNEILAPHLVRRARARAGLAAALAEETNARLAGLAAELPAIAIDYRPSPPEAAEDIAATNRALAAREAEESRHGVPLVGPQRDRVSLALGGSGARRFASAGEQKIVALALLSALARLLESRGRAPLVLLDDPESELDPRRAALAAALFRDAAQVVSTATGSGPKAGFEGARWKIENGAINRADSDI